MYKTLNWAAKCNMTTYHGIPELVLEVVCQNNKRNLVKNIKEEIIIVKIQE